jgi:nitrite reductase (NADH) small subunit
MMDMNPKEIFRFDVGMLEDVPRLGSRCVKTAQGHVAIFRTSDDQLFALRDECPHRGAPLSQGIVHGTSVTCPLHNWVVSLQTGAVDAPDEGRVETLDVRLENERIILTVLP